ncbi:DinB family protein [Aquimarina hainanensis]|uniref:DinB family protein n=1 Tax=Aquimarina hainanensis TaxID=1578017 RepID=A0ABW5N5S7_9FLAO
MNQGEIRKYIARLDDCFEGVPWYGVSVLEKLHTIDYKDVGTVPVDGVNSIAKLVRHMVSWRDFVIEKLLKNKAFDIQLNTAADWPEITIHSEKDWKDLVSTLYVSQSRIKELLLSETDAILDVIVPGKSYTYKYMIEGIIQHDIYHLGQIGIASKLINLSKISVKK